MWKYLVLFFADNVQIQKEKKKRLPFLINLHFSPQSLFYGSAH